MSYYKELEEKITNELNEKIKNEIDFEYLKKLQEQDNKLSLEYFDKGNKFYQDVNYSEMKKYYLMAIDKSDIQMINHCVNDNFFNDENFKITFFKLLSSNNEYKIIEKINKYMNRYNN